MTRLAVPRATLAVPGGSFRLTVVPEPASHFGAAPVRALLRWGQDLILLRAPVELVIDLLRSLAPALIEGPLAPDVIGLLLETALLPAIQAVERTGGRSLDILALEADNTPPPEGGPPLVFMGELNVALEDGERRWPLQLAQIDVSPAAAPSTARPGAPEPYKAAPALAALLDLWPAAPRPMPWLTVPIHLRLGVTRLPARVVASLRPGDAVLLQTRQARGGMLVVAERWAAAAIRSSPDGWTLIDAPVPAGSRDKKDWTMQDDASVTHEPAVAAIADPDDLPVALAFEVGRLDITIGELRRLGPGSVIRLGGESVDLVRITAGGRPIGTGNLVEVDGAIAVRIARVFDHG